MSLHRAPRRSPRRALAAAVAATALTLLGGVWINTASAGTAGRPDDVTPVATASYDLGDSAFRVPDFHTNPGGTEPAPLELTGVVHYPRGLAGGPRPLVLVAHGLWETCVVPQPPAPPPNGSMTWPCASQHPVIPSFRGLDYLGAALAGRGFVVVSIGLNGVNAGEQGEAADAARAAVLNKHLAMWQQLAATGGGPLAGKLGADFRGKVDLSRGGTFGHSRGGGAVMWQAAAVHAADVPAGVRIKAVLPFAPAGIALPDDPEMVANYQLKGIPFLMWDGTCDYAAHGEDYDGTARDNTATSRRVTVQGADHNFANTVWSPSSPRTGGYDD